MCIPSSTISSKNCRSLQQVASTAHQIARAAATFGVTEIVVFDSSKTQEKQANIIPVTTTSLSEGESKSKKIVFGDEIEIEIENEGKTNEKEKILNDKNGDDELSDQDKLIGFLEYFVTPSYLRKSLFGNKLYIFDVAKKFPKLPGLPFINHNEGRYFIGLSVSRKLPKPKRKKVSSSGRKRQRKSKPSSSSDFMEPGITNYINIGEKKVFKLGKDVKVPINSIVVVDRETGTIVSPEEVFSNRSSNGSSADEENTSKRRQHETSEIDWTSLGYGYKVRKITSYDKLFTECPFEQGYRYTALAPCMEFLNGEEVKEKSIDNSIDEIPLLEEETFLIKGITATPGDDIPILLVVGKWRELEQTILKDMKEESAMLDKAQELFDGRLRMGRGHRVEDAVLIALSKIEGL